MLAGEVWGLEGGAKVNSNWRSGLRWLSGPLWQPGYSRGLEGTDAAGFEIGITLYTDRI